ncbi:hypothetical protein SAMN05660860_02116 [Geoalkalibacter ferrihydriticus]|uniref:SatD family (SatD) n=1 Tax=Geoalkalibacter ferrihydriticus TaxID=392333 RepID=A0A1G9RDZ8_9BACT|nr:LysR family transcriptional regulator [Geoalkalibacter ferrihydriticus]SDM21549.1 hypothetical protein SAMN05660860_02116 [Geoalkalibacter ferrihydriticus]
MNSDDLSVCLHSDLVPMARRRVRDDAVELIETALGRANEVFTEKLVLPLTLGSGHEWRGVIVSLPAAVEIDMFLRHRLFPLQITTGIGRGELGANLSDGLSRMAGSCLMRSRKGLERARRHRGGTFLFSGDPLLDAGANTIFLLLQTLFETWTEKQLEAYLAYRRYGTEAQAAEAVGITQSALHQRLAAARAKTYELASEQLLWFVGNFPAVYPDPSCAEAS